MFRRVFKKNEIVSINELWEAIVAICEVISHEELASSIDSRMLEVIRDNGKSVSKKKNTFHPACLYFFD